MKKLFLAAVSFSATTVLLSGAALAASTISTTGPGSYNNIKVKNVQKCKVKNNNNVGVTNSTSQSATTGNASVKHNTTGGDATSGDAENTAGNTVSANLTNNASCASLMVAPVTCDSDASIDTTGPWSKNKVSCKAVNKVKVSNNNTVNVGNVVVQGAATGNASVWGNTTGGNATSGGASNSSTNSVTLTVTNN